METKMGIKNVEELFEMYTHAAMKPKKYDKNKTLPKTVTVELKPDIMAVLTAVACRIGCTRAQAITQILGFGVCEAALGCGFEFEEDDRKITITKESLKWDTTPRDEGIFFKGGDK